MARTMDIDQYRVKPGTKVKLSARDPGDKAASPGNKEEDAAQLTKLGERLDQLQDVFYAAHRHKLLVVLQGMDTSGKDGTIRHVFRQVDPLGVRVVSFKAPTTEELEHDFLWRAHRQVPGKGEIAIFNRSHYEDVLIVRVRNWIDAAECKQRFQQINDFERMLAENGTVIVKFFLHISKDEQRKRLQERLDNPDKQWKFNPGDLAERALWKDYMAAYEDMLNHTSTEQAPWFVVPADSKANRNLVVSRILVDALERLKLRYPAPAENLSGIVVE